MGITIKIAGVDRTNYIDARSFHIIDELTSKVNSASFDFYCSDVAVAPIAGEAVLIEEGSTKLFSGRILTKIEDFFPPNLLKYKVECIDNARDLDKKLVVESYTNEKAGDIIKDIIDSYTTGFTYVNTADGPTISDITFDYIQVSEAITKIAEICGYEWYIDYDKDIHFFAENTYPASFQLDDNQKYYKDLVINADVSQLRNRIYVKSSGYTEKYFSDVFIGDGSTTSWTCKFEAKDYAHNKLTDPPNLPTGRCHSVAFSHDSKYLAIAHLDSPYITIYERSGDTFIKLDDPDTLPTGSAWGVVFSHDSTYLAVAHNISPWITIYKRSANTFTKLANPADLPTGVAYSVDFSHDSTYLAVAHADSIYILIYKRSGDTFTKLANPADLPANFAYGVAFSHDSTYLAVAHLDSPYILIYKRSGDTFTKLANPADLPANDGRGVDFSHDSTYLAVAHADSPYILIYKRSGDTFTKLSNPADLPTGDGLSVAFSHDSTNLAVAHNISPYITIYERSGDTFTKLDNPATLPTGIGWGIAFSHDSIRLAIAYISPSYMNVYKRLISSATLNGVAKTVGRNGVDDPTLFNYMLDATTKVLSLGTGEGTPADGDELIVTYSVVGKTIMLRRDDEDSISTIAGIEGGDGIFEFCLTDNKIDSVEWANEAAKADLLQNADLTINAVFTTNKADVKSGQIITLNSTKRNINQNFLIQRVELIRVDAGIEYPTIPYKPAATATIGYKAAVDAVEEYRKTTGEIIRYIYQVTIATKFKRLEDLFLYLLNKANESV